MPVGNHSEHVAILQLTDWQACNLNSTPVLPPCSLSITRPPPQPQNTLWVAGACKRSASFQECACVQRGIDLPSLDVTYFTSLSYYMLLLFGLRGVMSLIFKEETIDETQIQKQQMTMGMSNMGQDPQKAFEQERSALDAVSGLLLYLCYIMARLDVVSMSTTASGSTVPAISAAQGCSWVRALT